MEIKLVATDMDGTFLDENHEFDQALFLKVLKKGTIPESNAI